MDQPGENAIERRRKIFQEYEKVIAECGPNAQKWPKKEFYMMVADRLGYSPEWVRKTVASFLKKKK